MNSHDNGAVGRLWRADGRDHYRIDDVGEMDPFLMTVVSSSDLWMFVSSTGSLTAGRIDADRALFPYQTDDRLHAATGIAGPITMIVRSGPSRELWRPFGREQTPDCTRSLAKSVIGDRILFEEHHHLWGLRFRATWAPSDAHGWVRTVELIDESGHEASYDVLDGFVDVMPAGVDVHTEMTRSNLADAYKRSEIGPWGRVALFTLESLISDRAEPAEALTATAVWSTGFDQAEVHLDPRAVDDMLRGRFRPTAPLLTGRPGAYLLRGTIELPAGHRSSWTLVADTDLDHARVVDVVRFAETPDAMEQVGTDIELGSVHLASLLDGADAVQETGDALADAHHLSNVLFNSMRGGVFPFGHEVPVADFAAFLRSRNRPVADRHRSWVSELGSEIDVHDLRNAAAATGDRQLVRLVLEYLPLTFSRRHGDPSRPWNRFSINLRTEVGEPVLSYEGNWRDIFQNWEALLHSFPAYLPHVVAKFVNASTLDGFNPYRISRHGIDWEVPDPNDPWSHIGYWGDHQIVYLTRLLEAWERHEPAGLAGWLDQPLFSYADVPYVLTDHQSMIDDPRHTIEFDTIKADAIADREANIGSDGRLLTDDETVLQVGLAEKLIVPALAKLSSFVPGGGIWLNTQRPEWNDANNALAGPGLSMVTLFHLQRYLALVAELMARSEVDSVPVTSSVAAWMREITAVLDAHPPRPVDDRERRVILDALGHSGEAHRRRTGQDTDLHAIDVAIADVRHFIQVAEQHLDQTSQSARRPDGLYHSYNRISFPDAASARVDHLGPMLEGQVAALSSRDLDTAASLELIDVLFASEMYRPDQETFMLYPATDLPSFLERNRLSEEAVARIRSLAMSESVAEQVFATDGDGHLHFRSAIVNTGALADLLDQGNIEPLARQELLDIHEEVFDHGSFTGRSGRMYGYEGLGSVYWHMVAKLLLAIQEVYSDASDRDVDPELRAATARAYRRVRAGLGFVKDPVSYGAIPTDCYSHTPAHGGAQQPGMTGQVKEEILTRFGELGLRVIGGRVVLAPGLLGPEDVFPGPAGRPARLQLCGVPMTITEGEEDRVTVLRTDGTTIATSGLVVSADASADVFARRGAVAAVEWVVGPSTMDHWLRDARSSTSIRA